MLVGLYRLTCGFWALYTTSAILSPYVPYLVECSAYGKLQGFEIPDNYQCNTVTKLPTFSAFKKNQKLMFSTRSETAFKTYYVSAVFINLSCLAVPLLSSSSTAQQDVIAILGAHVTGLT